MGKTGDTQGGKEAQIFHFGDLPLRRRPAAWFEGAGSGV